MVARFDAHPGVALSEKILINTTIIERTKEGKANIMPMYVANFNGTFEKVKIPSNASFISLVLPTLVFP